MNWNDFFISPQQLRHQLTTNPSLRIFDCRFNLMEPQQGQIDFDKNHIANAQYLHLDKDLSGETSASSGRHPLPTPKQLATLQKALGLTPDSQVVVYDQAPMAFAARAWFILFLMGIHRVRILQGGWAAWLENKDNCPPSNQTQYTFSETMPILKLLTLEQLMTSNNHYIPVDAREAQRFLGISEPIDPAAGTIPSAINAEWLSLYRQGELLPIAQQESSWQQLLENSPTTKPHDMVHFCGSGVTALMNIISRFLVGDELVYFYPGGWSEFIHSKYFQ